MCQNSQGLVSHYILHLIIHPTGDIPSMQKLAGVLWSKAGVTLKRRVEVGTSSSRPADQVPPSQVWVSRGPTIHHPWVYLPRFSCEWSCLVPDLVILFTGDRAHVQGSCSVICWHVLQQLPQPRDSPNLGTRAAQAPEMWNSLGSWLEGNGAGIWFSFKITF